MVHVWVAGDPLCDPLAIIGHIWAL